MKKYGSLIFYIGGGILTSFIGYIIIKKLTKSNKQNSITDFCDLNYKSNDDIIVKNADSIENVELVENADLIENVELNENADSIENVELVENADSIENVELNENADSVDYDDEEWEKV